MKLFKTWTLLGLSSLLVAQSSQQSTSDTSSSSLPAQPDKPSLGNAGSAESGQGNAGSDKSSSGNDSLDKSSSANDSLDNSSSGNVSSNSSSDSKIDKNDEKDKDGGSGKSSKDSYTSAYIRINEPVYLETAKKASISISRAAIFKWEYYGKPKDKPKTLTMTLEENRGYKVAYVIEPEISISETKYIWDIPNYRPSQNDSESITLKPGSTYKMYLHDSRFKYDALYTKGSYRSGVREFLLFSSSDPSNPFGSAASIKPTLVSIIVMIMLGFTWALI